MDWKKDWNLKTTPLEKLGIPVTFDDFCKIDSVSYFLEQLRGPRYKNTKPNKSAGTRFSYAYRLWSFNNWLHGKTFEFHVAQNLGNDTFKSKVEKVRLDGVDHLLRLYREPHTMESEFVKIIKKYLLDPMHEKKRAATMKIDYNAIKAFFEKNDMPINLKFDYNVKYKTTGGEDEQPSLSIDDLMNLLTVGKPNLCQKAVFLCKLHRGLDTSTLIDLFNFQAWSQLVEHFGTENYQKWDLKKCPVPIKLTRIKTDYTHTGFLERDAVESIQRYLESRRKRTMREMREGEAMFLNVRNQPITKEWIDLGLKKLARNAGLDKTLQGYMITKYRINPHEFRDLLKSTLIDCGVRPDLADHFIGHKPKDSYEKQSILYPETMRREYSKASKMLNVFSNFSSFVKGGESNEELQSIKTRLDDVLQKVDELRADKERMEHIHKP